MAKKSGKGFGGPMRRRDKIKRFHKQYRLVKREGFQSPRVRELVSHKDGTPISLY